MTLATELQRKGIHVALIVIPIVAWWLLPFLGPLVLAALWLGFLAGGALDLGRRRHGAIRDPVDRQLGHLYRPHEEHHPLGSTLYLLGAALSFTLFPRTVGLVAMACLVFGDTAAALVGTALGRVRLGNGKSLEGSAACFVACLAVGAAAGSWIDPRLSLRAAFVVAFLATLAELLVPRGYDNVAVPLLAGSGLILMTQGN